MKFLTIRLLVAAVMLLAAKSAFASYSYNFTVNTSSIAGEAGYVDLMFNPGDNSEGAATAHITNFTTDAALGSAVLTGGASGTLPNVTIANNPLSSSSPYNDYLQALTFGQNINFALNLSGAAGNSFFLYFYNGDFSQNLLTKDQVTGIATEIDLTQNVPNVINNSSQVSVSATPVPAAAYLFGSGLLGLVGILRKINN